MAKYLKLFMVALFATMTFALTSCGDDDKDEPNEPTAKGSITVNGVAYKGAQCFGDISCDFTSYDARLGMDANLCLEPVNQGLLDIENHTVCDVSNLHFEYEEIIKGMTLKMDEIDHAFITISVGMGIEMSQNSYHNYISGSISVDDFNGATITLNLHHLTFANDEGEKVVINGLIECKYYKIG